MKIMGYLVVEGFPFTLKTMVRSSSLIGRVNFPFLLVCKRFSSLIPIKKKVMMCAKYRLNENENVAVETCITNGQSNIYGTSESSDPSWT